MRNISQTVRDRELVSTGHHYKVTHGLSKKGEIFDLWWPWKVKVSLDLQFCLQNFWLVWNLFFLNFYINKSVLYGLNFIFRHNEKDHNWKIILDWFKFLFTFFSILCLTCRFWPFLWNFMVIEHPLNIIRLKRFFAQSITMPAGIK